MSRSESSRFPVTVSRLPVTRCEVCGRTLAYRPGHASAALTGLVIWLGFVDTGLDLLAWLGVTVVTGTIALGVCTVTLWTPFPIAVPPAPAAVPEAMPAAEDGTITDEMIASLLADPFPASRRPRLKLAGLVPVVHGFAALATFMLAVLAAISAR